MAADGYPVDPDEVLALLPEGASAGRPHLARALVAAGVVASVDEAFATLLYNGSPYYVPKADTPVRTADRHGPRRPAGSRCSRTRWPAAAAGSWSRRSSSSWPRPGSAGSRSTTPTTPRRTASCCARSPPSTACVTTGSSDYHGTNKTTPIAAETHRGGRRWTPLVARATGVEVAQPGGDRGRDSVGPVDGGAQLGLRVRGAAPGQGHPGPAGHLGRLPPPLPA